MDAKHGNELVKFLETLTCEELVNVAIMSTSLSSLYAEDQRTAEIMQATSKDIYVLYRLNCFEPSEIAEQKKARALAEWRKSHGL